MQVGQDFMHASDIQASSTVGGQSLRLHPDDNVAIALAELSAGSIAVLGEAPTNVSAIESVPAWHKIALNDIREGEVVCKYGVSIGIASAPIKAGAWVHTHNCRSGVDVRSHTLDPHTGAATDTAYE